MRVGGPLRGRLNSSFPQKERVRPPQLAASFIRGPHTRRRRLRDRFLKPFLRGVRGGEDFDVLGVANLLAGVDVDPDCFHESLRAHQAARRSRGLVVRRFVLRGCLTAACRIRANTILCIAKRFWDLMPLRRDQKLFPHLGEAGTAVFAVQEVEYGGHDLTPLFDLHHQLQAIIFLGAKDVN